MSSFNGILNRFFKIEEKGSSVKNELLAGMTTFMAMAYIIFVVPGMLGDAGMPRDAAITATILTTAIITLGMGLWANFPVAVAPGMGITAFFAYYVCGVMGLSWQVGLGAVFISGILFLILTVTRLRQLIIDSVPMDMKYAIVVGIGMFIAFIGLKNCGIIVANQATFVGLGDLTNPGTLLAIVGVFIISGMMARNMAGAILVGILAVTLLGMIVGEVPLPKSFGDIASLNFPSITPILFEMDVMGAVSYGLFSIVFTLTIVDLFDNIGTLIGLSRKAGLMDKNGHIPNLDKALITDSIGTMMSACIGTTTATTYIESAAGVAAGGRTGLTAVTVSALFLIALIFAPLVGIVPAFATAPALIVVGALMMQEVVHIKFDDFTVAVPAFMTIIMMPLTYSIASGFGFGFISYAVLKTLAGRHKEVSVVMWVISLCFAINFFLRLH